MGTQVLEERWPLEPGRNQMLMLGGALLIAAVVVGFGLRALVADDPDGGDEVDTAMTGSDGDTSAGQGAEDDEDTGTTDPDLSVDSGGDGDSSTTAEADVSAPTATSASTTSQRQPDPTFVELAGLTLTRTGECPAVTVALDAVITVASGGNSITYSFPDDGGLLEGTVTERSGFELGAQVSESVGDDWTVSVFSREHLAEGAYSANHSSPASVSGTYPGPAGMGVDYEIAEANGLVTVGPLVLSASSDCQTVAPTVLISFSSSDGTDAADNGGTTQMPAAFGQPIPLLDPVRFDLSDGWKMTVFVRDDWSGRSLSRSHDTADQVSEVLAATAAGDPELTVAYSISVG